MSDRGWSAFPFQEQAWAAYAEGHAGTINVPTGAGKTYAAYFGPLAELIEQPTDALSVLYVTPLRAVARDIEAALKLPVSDLDLPVTVEGRTGDTTSSVRARQRKRQPNVLVTTPESLCLMLTWDNAARVFANLRCVILDEWHELLASKRGSQTELALTRVRSFSPDVRTWSLSATLANQEEAARCATGVGPEPIIVRSDLDRPVLIDSVLPDDPSKFPWAGHLGLTLLDRVVEVLDVERSTLVFVNTRSQAELWYQAIQHARPEWASVMALHHGSVDRDVREKIEQGLNSGDVRLVVATSSLDLGVDFAPVEHVVQIGSPKGIARLIQRAGRASHRPGESCRITCVPTHGLEIIEIAAVRRAMREGVIEGRNPDSKPMDVLAQHMVTCALGGGFTPDELFEQVTRAWSFRDLTRQEFDWTLELVHRGGGTLARYPEYCKIEPDESGRYRVTSRRIAQMHRLNVGTIAGDMTVQIRFANGRRIGNIEERFVANLTKGQKFVFGGRVLEFVSLHGLTCLVRRSSGRTRFTPHWAGTRLPITESMSASVRATLEAARDGDVSNDELQAAQYIVSAQTRLSKLPGAHELLVESALTREGRHLFLFPFEGRLVHAGLAALLALRLSRATGATFSTAVNDYGLELLTDRDVDLSDRLTPELFSTDGLIEESVEAVNLGELAKRQFREVARVAGLIFPNIPGAHKGNRHLSATAGLIYEVFLEFDPENLLLEQARREVLEKQFERSRLSRTMDRLRESPIVLVETEKLTPLAFPLVLERLSARVSTKSIAERVESMRKQWEAS